MDKLIEKITNKLEFAQANESEIRPVFFRLKDEALRGGGGVEDWTRLTFVFFSHKT